MRLAPQLPDAACGCHALKPWRPITLPKDAADVAKPGAVGTAAPSNEPMTAKAYAQAVEALRQKLGNRTEDSPEYAALQSQRLAARRAGY